MSLFVPPRAQYSDTNGNPLAGAKLYFYRTGTSTPQDTYTDSGLTTPNANPVIADASGIFGSIYLATSNDYKVILKNSADTTIWTVDPYLASTGTGRTAVADASYAATINDRLIAYTSLTANRVVTLPAALTFPAGTRLSIVDESGSSTASSKVIQVAPSGSDTINGATGTQDAVASAYGDAEYECNGSTGWFQIGSSVSTQSQANNSPKRASTAYVDRVAVQQVVSTITGAVATGSTTIPIDDTIPQNTEGDQYMSLAITPKSATSKLRITVNFICSQSGTAATITVALFQDSTANALAAVPWSVPGLTYLNNVSFTHVMTSGTTSATTFKVRAGVSNGSTLTFNGFSGGRSLGGVIPSSIVIEEIGV